MGGKGSGRGSGGKRGGAGRPRTVFHLEPEAALALRELQARSDFARDDLDGYLNYLILRAHEEMRRADELYPDRVGGVMSSEAS